MPRRISSAAAPADGHPPRLCSARTGNSDRAARAEVHIRAERTGRHAPPPSARAIRKASERHPDAVFGKVDTEAQPELAAAFEIRSIPTLMVIRDGIVLYAQPGALPEAALERLITKAGELDMDEVRATAPAPAGA